MLKARNDLENYLERKFLKYVTNYEVTKNICSYAEVKHDIPQMIVLDFVTMRTPLSEASEFVLFCILEALEYITTGADDLKINRISHFYTESEIKTYSVSKYKVDKIKFPIRFKAIQVNETQWLTTIDFKTLMKLRAAQLIIYNENTQRTMERIIRGDKEVYRIKLDKNAVQKIEKSYLEGTYIPTPFTFNMPEENSNFYYDNDTCELVIKELSHFDIVDGYHRYIAACKACDTDKNFNFTMELRIVSIPEYKAQHFIFQEDQKTRMKKADSDTYDQGSLANQIVDRINTDPTSNIKGMIGRNQSPIRFTDMAAAVKYYYLLKEKSKNANQLLLSLKKEIISCFNMLTEYDEKYLEMKYTYRKLLVIIHCFAYFREKDKTKMCEVIDETLEKAADLDPYLFKNYKPRSGVENAIQKIVEEVLSNV